MPIIRCTNDGVLIHEIGHYLGLSHHYEEHDASDIGEGKLMPPGSRTCRMDRTVGWCTACLAALDIDPGTYQEERLSQAIQLLHDHYDQ